MTTRRGAKEKTPLTEGEIEIIGANLTQRENRIHEEMAAFEKQREEFALERKDFNDERERKEHTIGQLEATIVALRNDVARELTQIRANTHTSAHDLNRAVSPIEQPTDRDPHYHDPHYRERTSYELPRASMENPKVSFREATESIPTFDGYNIALAQFARACRRAREIVPPACEYNLTKLIINRLRGRAYYAVEDEPCDTVTQLIDLLNGAFGSPKTIDQYRGELSTCYLRSGEHMLDYISKIKDLRTAILDAERRERGEPCPSTSREIDELTARSFCDGLPLQYRLQMRPEHHVRPFEAFSAAKVLAKREELDRQRNTRHIPTPRADTIPRAPPPRDTGRPNNGYRPQYSRPSRDTPPLRAIEDGPRALPPRDDYRRAPPTRPAANGIWCRYCKTPGHEIHECRKRAYNNNNGNTNNNNPRQGNYQGPSTRQDPSRAGQQLNQAIRSIEATQEEHSESESSEQELLHTPPQ